MRFASLGSGSAGNGLIVEHNTTRLLLDCGFSIKETENRLAKFSLSPEMLSGILVTHEHDDHAGGVFKFAAKHNIPVWLTHGTLCMVERYMPKLCNSPIHIIDSHQAIAIRDIEVQPYPVPHDAREPVQFVFTDGNHKLGVLTDTGTSTPHIEFMLNACNALLLECNHDMEMLLNGPYSRALKARVSGRLGHLDNASSASLLSKLDNSKLQHLVAAHLSAKNNLPELAKKALASVLNCDHDWIAIADQDNGLEWRDIR